MLGLRVEVPAAPEMFSFYQGDYYIACLYPSDEGLQLGSLLLRFRYSGILCLYKVPLFALLFL